MSDALIENLGLAVRLAANTVFFGYVICWVIWLDGE